LNLANRLYRARRLGTRGAERLNIVGCCQGGSAILIDIRLYF